MKLSKFFRTIKYKGSLTIVMKSIQFKFKWIEAGTAKVEIITKADVDKSLTEQIGFEVYNWESIEMRVDTCKAWHMYENIKVNGMVLLKLKDVDKEYWLDKDEI